MTNTFKLAKTFRKSIQQPQTVALPQSLLSNSRIEYYDDPHRDQEKQSLNLTIKAGLSESLTTLPADLMGALFMVGPAGAVDSTGASDSEHILPSHNGLTCLLNGDGMVCRVEFIQGKAKLSSKLVKTVSYYADEITHRKYPFLRFASHGIARISRTIGVCDQLNTGFLSLQRKGKDSNRLLVTWDMGRPVEIDPVSLNVIGPVGQNNDWQAMSKIVSFFQPLILKLIMSSAHPVYVPNDNEVYTVNIVQSLRQALGLSQLYERCIQFVSERFENYKILDRVINVSFGFAYFCLNAGIDSLQALRCLEKEDVHLIRWNSKTDTFSSWKLRLADGSSIDIKQTVHQIGLTRQYIIFGDMSFKTSLADILPGMQQNQVLNWFEQMIFSWLTKKKNYLICSLTKGTSIYLVERAQLKKVSPGGEIKAKKILINDASISHYEVDYDDQGDKITLHAGLTSSTNFADFIRKDDYSAFGDRTLTERMKKMAGFFVSGMEVNCPVTYVIDAKKGVVEHEAALPFDEASEHTWSLGVCTHPEHSSSDRIEDIYWSGFGAWPEALPQSILELYRDRYSGQPEELESFLQKVKEGVPTSICRVHIDRTQEQPELSVADSYKFPKHGYFAKTPQFIPKENATGAIDGYIICTVNYSDNLCSIPKNQAPNQPSWSANTEFWIFDATNLKQGPLYRLSHAKLNLGMTLHTTWLREISSPKKRRHYNVRQDFEKRVAAAVKYHSKRNPYQAEQIAQLFEEVYAQVEQDQSA